MKVIVSLYSNLSEEIQKFLKLFYNNDFVISKDVTEWKKEYDNPIEIVDIISAYIENIDDFNITMWVSLDSGVFIKITQDNCDELIRYLYERFPY